MRHGCAEQVGERHVIRRSLFSLATAVSMLLCLAALAGWASTTGIKPLDLSDDFHVVSEMPLLGWLSLVFLVFTMIFIVLRMCSPTLAAHRKMSCCCIECGYSLVGNTTGFCPECGTAWRG
jgi:uncharacterized BrkB/YihY/UPF0761 family membrane protein